LPEKNDGFSISSGIGMSVDNKHPAFKLWHMAAIKKTDIILAVLSAGGGNVFTPVKIQKVLFLIDKKIPELVGGPFFNFEPYDYGPFDATIYQDMEQLAANGLVEIIQVPNLRWKKYRPTPDGLKTGVEILKSLDSKTSDYIQSLTDFVRKLSFAELVGAIYKAYPEMKVNSVFRG
jgi:uncharacterized protein